jgi:hypothetical protein
VIEKTRLRREFVHVGCWEVAVDDSVAVDAKRILLRYGVPIAVLDGIGEADRIVLAREVSRTPVPDRGYRLQDLLVERGLLDAETVAASRSRKGRRRK